MTKSLTRPKNDFSRSSPGQYDRQEESSNFAVLVWKMQNRKKEYFFSMHLVHSVFPARTVVTTGYCISLTFSSTALLPAACFWTPDILATNLQWTQLFKASMWLTVCMWTKRAEWPGIANIRRYMYCPSSRTKKVKVCERTSCFPFKKGAKLGPISFCRCHGGEMKKKVSAAAGMALRKAILFSLLPPLPYMQRRGQDVQ